MTSFGEHLAALRTGRGLSQSQLAARAGCAQSTIVRVEDGTIRPVPELFMALCQALDVPAEQRLALACVLGWDPSYVSAVLEPLPPNERRPWEAQVNPGMATDITIRGH